jgi:hypothetical protein
MKIGYFEEEEGVKSSMRLMSFISLLTAIVISIISVINNQLDSNILILISSFIVGAFAPKSVQKFAENKVKQ